MADDRTFTLIGQFRDEISPALEKINKNLAQTKRAFESLGTKRSGIDTLTKNLGKVTGAHKRLTAEVGNLRSEMQKSFSTIKEYNRLMGKAVGANRRMQQSTAQAFGQQARDIARTNSQLRQYGTLSKRLNRGGGGGGGGGGGPTRRPPGPSRTPRMSGGGGGGGGGGGRGRYYDESRDAGLAFGTTLGYSLSNVIVGGVTKGFEIGVSLMRKPFDYFVQGLGERIQDELSDLKAAGGYYGIAKRQKDPFVKTFDQALEFTQQNNKVMAKLAAALPGSTQDYIEVSKRIGDTVARTVSTDKGAAIKYAETLRMEQPNIYGKKALEGTGTDASQRAIQVMLGELTKKTVLAGQGGRSGAGGAKGPYGLPGLSERILSQESVSVAQFQRYSAIFSDPAILDALQRYVPQLNKTAKNSVDRFKTIMKFYDDVLPPELIEKYRRSIAGLQESFNTAILGPETGLFGLGRKMDGLGYKMNDFGQYVDEFGNATENATKFIKAELSVFDMLRDIVANTSIVLMPIIENITLLYDPLKKIGFTLKDARHYTAQFLQSFNYYKNGLTAFAKTLDKAGMEEITATRDLRATFAAVSNLFKQFGVFDSKEFEKMMGMIKDPKANLGAILKSLIDTFLNSDVAKKIGEFLGVLVGTVLSEVANLVGVIAGVVEGGPLVNGFTTGFKDAGGPKAIQSIFENVFKALWKAFTWVFSQAPLQFTILGAVTTLIPALTAGLGVVIAGFIERVFKALPKLIKSKLATDKVTKAVSKASLRDPRTISAAGAGFRQTSAENMRRGASKNASFRSMPTAARTNALFPNVALPGGVLPGVSGVTGPTRAPSIPKSLVKPPKIRGAGKMGAASAAINGVLAFDKAVSNTGNVLKKVVKTVGKAGVAFTALDFGIRVAQGENAGTAALGAGGALAGGAIGAVVGQTLLPFLPGIGAVIGSLVGSFLGDWVATQLPALFANFPAKMTAAFTAVTKWFDEAPAKLGVAIGTFIADVQIWFDGLPQSFSDWLVKFKTSLNNLLRDLGLSWDNFIASVSTGGTIDWNKLGVVLAEKINGALRLAMALVNPVNMAGEVAKFMSRSVAPGTKAYESKIKEQQQVDYYNKQYGSSFAGSPAQMHGSLGSAISSEMRNKPSGSDLVIANSSETVIPAAGGLNNGIDGLISAIRTSGQSVARSMQTGLNVLTQTIIRSSEQTTNAVKQSGASTTAAVNQASARSAQQNAALMTAVKAGGMGGGLGGGTLGGGAGGAGIFGAAASRFGLTMTSGYRPGDPGYHGIDRARDYSNSTGPTPQMMQFAQFLASTYGSNLKELIYTPLGFSIKNGQRVAPYAQSAHYNHVHVAYAYGEGNPAFFSSQKDAQSFEDKLIPSNVKSITTNTGELAGLFDGLMGKKPTKLKPGQKPTMNELGTDTGYKMLLRKQQTEEAMKMLKGISYDPSRQSSPANATNIGDLAGLFDGLMGKKPEKLKPGQKPTMDQLGTGTGYKMLQRKQQTEEAMKMLRGVSYNPPQTNSPVNVTNTITIQQLPGQDADQLAAIVARKIGEAISDVQSSSIFV